MWLWQKKIKQCEKSSTIDDCYLKGLAITLSWLDVMKENLSWSDHTFLETYIMLGLAHIFVAIWAMGMHR